jgi:hypothetical protein
MTNDYYQLPLTERRRMLADAGFARNDLRIWQHASGRAIGEGVAAALTDDAFHRFLNIEAPAEEKTRDGQKVATVIS